MWAAAHCFQPPLRAPTQHTRKRCAGWTSFEYHDDVLQEAARRHPALTLRCVGGGRIKHDAARRTIHVYGFSQAYGRANHEAAVEILRAAYPAYSLTWSDDGY